MDSAPREIEIAREKARERDLPVTFMVQDALRLEDCGRTFDTVIDSGLFHALSDPERPRFVRIIAAALRPGGTSLMLALSELEPGDYGPRRSRSRRSGRYSTDGESTGSGPRSSRG